MPWQRTGKRISRRRGLYYGRSLTKVMPPAQYALGRMYENGRGVVSDETQASEWYRKSADQGYGAAQYHLGMNYANGAGVPLDYAQAYLWVSLAAKWLPASEVGGRAQSLEARDIFATKMTPVQIAAAENLVRNWKPKSPADLSPKGGERAPNPPH